MFFKKVAARLMLVLMAFFIIITASSAEAVLAEGNDIKNLVKGLEYSVETGEPIGYSYSNYEPDTYDMDSGQLTDGATAMTDDTSSAWYRSISGGSRIVTFDLGSSKAVNGFYAGFLQMKKMNIFAPRYVLVHLSEDGEKYLTVCRTEPDFSISDDNLRRADISADFEYAYKVRYVKVEYCSDIFAYCDEIKVFGKDTLSGKEKTITPDEKTIEKGYLINFGGKKDIIKIYNGFYNPQSLADNTAEELLPYIAYIQSDGSYTDTMFDSVAFVPCHTDYPSGGRLVKTKGKSGAVMSDWLLYLENTFEEEKNVDALNKTVGEVYSKLHKKGKFTVYFTLPFPTVLTGAFGDIDGDGKEENCSTFEERVKILKWYANLTYSTFRKGNYKNLNFGGFYWYREEVNYSETDHEAKLVEEISKYLSKRKFDFLFDAFYLSTGFDHWKKLGFTGAVMQPNLIFRDYFEHEMFDEFASTLKKHNLGVEIETAEPASFNDNDYKSSGLTYERYLYYGWKNGYMNAIHTYYQGAGPGTIYNFCYAGTSTQKGIYLRSLYDKTYRYIKGTYTAYSPKVYIPDFETAAGQKNVRVNMTISDPDSEATDFTVEFTKLPEHGTVTALSNNKSIVFTAYKGYSGKDTFEVVVSDKFTKSDPFTVTVKIVDVISADSELSEESIEDIPPKKNNNIWYILIGAGVLIVAGVIVTLVIRAKNR